MEIVSIFQLLHIYIVLRTLVVIFNCEKWFEAKGWKELTVIADVTISPIPFNFNTLWIKYLSFSFYRDENTEIQEVRGSV